MLSEVDHEQQEQILQFWLGDQDCENDPNYIKQHSKRWYKSTQSLDDEIREKFGDLVQRAGSEQLLHWCVEPRGVLAHVILLDQFTRNIYRGSAQAYEFDPLARAVALRAYKRRLDEDLSVVGRIFLYHPFHHSELLSDQEFACEMMKEMVEKSPPAWLDLLKGTQSFFESHCETIRRFSRFPHRNSLLNRESTPDELEYLAHSSRFGQ